jgi:diguanylate cyclase (GGDEF)-like protein
MAMFAGDLILAGSLVRTGSYSSGEHANLLWLLSAVFWTSAAQSVRREPTISLKTTQEFSVDETLTRMSMLPYLAMAVSYGLLAFVGLRQQGGEFQVMLGAALLTTALVVTRQFIVLRENVRLLAERAALQRELSRQVVQDPVTELATRTHFQNRVKQALRRSHPHPERVAVMFLDLDDFKDVNDSLGHDKGDLLLREVALRLMHSTRGSDLVARLGGDEFAILVDRVLREEDLAIMANRIISSIAAPFNLEGSEVLTGISIGIARADGGMNADDLIGNADVAMYDAKQKGKGQFTFFKGEMQRAVYNRLTLESDLRRAVAGDEISLLYQPIVDMRNGAIVAVEALARWRHPTRGMLGPEQFIPLAEESGMMIPLGRLLLFVACSEAARWSKIAPGRSPAVAVNVSSRQLQHHGLADDVRAVLGTSRLPSEKLILEMTENVAVRDTQLTMQRLVGLKDLGVRLAIDNFGSGFSSIAELQRFPIDLLKMDKSFVRAAGRSESGRALARTIISLGKALGLETVAEGVESETEAQLLLGMGCHIAQGYHYSMPVPAEEIGRMIAEAPGPSSALTG